MAPKGHKKDCACPVCKKKKKDAQVTTLEAEPVVKEDTEIQDRLERCEVLLVALCRNLGLNIDKLYAHTKKRAGVVGNTIDKKTPS